MFLSQFDIVFVPQKAVKGQALANFLAAHPFLMTFPLTITATVVQSKWQMYFDGAH
jgi:hypothetical protein